MATKSLGWLYKARLVSSIIYDLITALLSFPWLVISFYLVRWGVSVPTIASTETPYKTSKAHEQEVERISRGVREAHLADKQIVLYRKPGHGHSARSAHYKAGHHAVDIASLTSILELNTSEEYVTVQAGVSFEELCRETLKYDLLPLVVPEFKSITVGGAIQGIGIESSSWRQGAVDETVISATLVLGDGRIVQSEEVPELWKHVPGSNGSLALVVSATLRLCSAAQFVRVQYGLFAQFEDFRISVDKVIKTAHPAWTWGTSAALLDAVLIRDVGIVAMSGECVEDIPRGSSAQTYIETPISPFFYQHIEAIATKLSMTTQQSGKAESYVEYMPTMQYLFRYDRGGFWGIKALGEMFGPLKFVLQRPLLAGCMNHFLKTSTLYKVAMLLPDFTRESVAMLQDVDLPQSGASHIVDWALEHEIEYLWLCPVVNQSKSMFAVSAGSEWVLNIGIYGTVTGLPHSNRDLQRLVSKCGGRVALYAHVYVDAKEFWSWYNFDAYLHLRDGFHGNSFLDLYRKVGGISQQVL